MNILLSSTQTWNPGDDFIRFGVVAILEAALGSEPLHTAIFDRSPRVHKESSGRDNTQANIQCHDDTYHGFDAIVIAGTPDWGKKNDLLYQQAHEHHLPIYMLGLGGVSSEHFTKSISPDTLYALQTAKLITVRDQLTSDHLTQRGIPHQHLPCPATLASLALSATPPPPDRHTAIITSDVPQTQRAALALYHTLTSEETTANSQVSLICHSSHERNTLVRAGHTPLYEHDPYRLLRLILRYQHIHSARLHGALPCLGAEQGRQVHLIDTHCPRIHGGYATAKAWYEEGKTTHALLTYYTDLLAPLL